MGFTITTIAEDGLLGGVLHPNTLYKTLKANGIQMRTYSIIDDEELRRKVQEYNREHPNAGI